jgi:hypothetical protein
MVDVPNLKKLSHHLGLSLPWGEDQLKASVSQLLDKYAFEATKYTLQKTKSFADARDKKLLVVLFDPYRVLRPLLEGEPRYDQEIVDFLQNKGYHYFDMNVVHEKDYRDFNLSIDDYFERYFIGHYNPMGNHFFAYQIKNHVIKMLEPKPLTHAKKDVQAIRFKGYLDQRSKMKD